MPAIHPKPTLVVSNTRRAKPLHTAYDGDDARVFGQIILKRIKSDPVLAGADYFTRESLLVHLADSPAFGRVSTITRYTHVRHGVHWLLDNGFLVRPNNSTRNLCLPNHERRAVRSLTNPVPLHLRYYDRILATLHDYKTKDTVDVVTVVRYWASGTAPANLTEDNMRVLVRQTLRHMARSGLLQENEDYTYTVLSALHDAAE